MMALALTVRLGSFDALPMAGNRRGDGERDGLGARQRTRAFGSWAPFEPHTSRAAMDYAKPRCARITLDALTRVLIGTCNRDWHLRTVPHGPYGGDCGSCHARSAHRPRYPLT